MRLLIVTAVLILLFACQCGQIPAPEPTATGTAVPSSTPPATPTRQISPTATVTAVPTQTATPLPTETVTAVPATIEPTATALPTAVPTSLPPDTYTVQADDWLIKIAIHLYGGRYGWQWRCLYTNNRDVIGGNPNLIFRGQVLRGVRGCGNR